VVAIDGSAGVGKSTVGNLVAKSLGFHFINTGEMYRALTWKALEEGMDPADEATVFALARRLKWEFRPTEEGTTLKTFVDGEGVSVHIREERVSRNTSAIAANSSVRRFFCALQRRMGRQGRIVMEGRDISTHVLPDAEFKIYLDASIAERAERRYRQLKAAGQKGSLAKIREGILKRDLNDLRRKINPLSVAEDAWLIDSTNLTMHEVAEKILGAIRRGHHRGPVRRRGKI
jgi:cytidylate kinase